MEAKTTTRKVVGKECGRKCRIDALMDLARFVQATELVNDDGL
jgi:hypothetical protein